MRYDVIVLGLGAMGSAAAYQLAKRGAKVLGIDRFSPPHAHGSSHGGTRITRLAIGEGEHYAPLAMRAHEIWREIENETGASLLTTNGGLVISSDGKLSKTHVDGFFQNTVGAAKRFGIPHELLDAAEIRRRYPQFAVGDQEYGYFEPSAGFVRPELCVHAHLQLAKKYAATLRTGETVLDFEPTPSTVRVVTDKGRYEADKLVIAAGSWAPQLLGPELAHMFKVHRQVQYWFAPKEGVSAFRPDRFPVFIWELRAVRQGIYGFPAIDGVTGGIKVATESFENTTVPCDDAREISAREIAAMYDDLIAPYFPGIGPVCVRATACFYTVTPDFGFVIDTHPQSDRVMVASPCSGHGFKHSPAIGEALAEWAMEHPSRHSLSAFRIDRFNGR
jgi:sarcosine oxidase